MAIVEESLAADSEYPDALAWQASGWFFQSGTAFTQGDWETGMALFDKSLAQFDRAVALAPDSFQTLIPRAATLLGAAPYVTHAPTRNEFLEKVVGDYTKVLELQEPYFDSLTVHSRGELLGALAEALWLQEKRDEAQVYLSRIVTELPEFPLRTDGAAATRHAGRARSAHLPRLPQVLSRPVPSEAIVCSTWETPER